MGGRDRIRIITWEEARRVSTHAPVGGRDTYIIQYYLFLSTFQLTRPWEGATTVLYEPHSSDTVSTHAPVGGRDLPWSSFKPTMYEFQLTRPWEGATVVLSARDASA